MGEVILRLSPLDPIIARDGRPFGAGQGRRMHSMSWPLPSVVAGSLRTALVKASSTLDFSGKMPERLMKVEVAGVFPVVNGEMYLPAPRDALAEPARDGRSIQRLHRLTPQENYSGGCDFPDDLPLRPVMLPLEQAKEDFKPAELPAWWPLSSIATWLAGGSVNIDSSFLCAPIRETRDHVCIDPSRATAAEGQIFVTSALNLTRLPRFFPSGEPVEDKRFDERFAPVSLTCRVITEDETFSHLRKLNIWHPMGGERRLIHWQSSNTEDRRLWNPPDSLRDAFAGAKKIRMILATPAIFDRGWLPGWIDEKSLEGKPPFENAPVMKLVGVISGRWEAVSGWSLAPPRGPKPVRRMVPAGSVYFFEVISSKNDGFPIDAGWLRPVSDHQQDRNDGFGLVVWGTW